MSPKSTNDDPSCRSTVCHIVCGNCTHNTSLINKFTKCSDVKTQKQITGSFSRQETAMKYRPTCLTAQLDVTIS